jgi:hypothetical protein
MDRASSRSPKRDSAGPVLAFGVLAVVCNLLQFLLSSPAWGLLPVIGLVLAGLGGLAYSLRVPFRWIRQLKAHHLRRYWRPGSLEAFAAIAWILGVFAGFRPLPVPTAFGRWVALVAFSLVIAASWGASRGFMRQLPIDGLTALSRLVRRTVAVRGLVTQLRALNLERVGSMVMRMLRFRPRHLPPAESFIAGCALLGLVPAISVCVSPASAGYAVRSATLHVNRRDWIGAPAGPSILPATGTTESEQGARISWDAACGSAKQNEPGYKGGWATSALFNLYLGPEGYGAAVAGCTGTAVEVRDQSNTVIYVAGDGPRGQLQSIGLVSSKGQSAIVLDQPARALAKLLAEGIAVIPSPRITIHNGDFELLSTERGTYAFVRARKVFDGGDGPYVALGPQQTQAWYEAMMRLKEWLWPTRNTAGGVDLRTNVDASPVAVLRIDPRVHTARLVGNAPSTLTIAPRFFGLPQMGSILDTTQRNWRKQVAESPGG